MTTVLIKTTEKTIYRLVGSLAADPKTLLKAELKSSMDLRAGGGDEDSGPAAEG